RTPGGGRAGTCGTSSSSGAALGGLLGVGRLRRGFRCLCGGIWPSLLRRGNLPAHPNPLHRSAVADGPLRGRRGLRLRLDGPLRGRRGLRLTLHWSAVADGRLRLLLTACTAARSSAATALTTT